MPGENALQEEVLREIDQEVHEILARGKREGERNIEEARRRKREKYRRNLQRLTAELEARRRRAVSRAELEGKNIILRCRREEVDRTFAEVRRQIGTMEKEEPLRYADMLWRSFSMCRSVLPPGRIRVRIGRGAEILRDRLEAEENLEIETSPSLEGIILESEDGKIHCDGSIHAILERLRRDREAEVEEMLFEEIDGE